MDTTIVRGRMLEEAKKIVTEDRANVYGSPEDNFALIAELWSNYLGVEIKPEDVALMMALLKIARIKTGKTNMDNYVDLAGYAACAAGIAVKDLEEY